MHRKWLVAHDLSQEAERALGRAAEQLTALGGGELVLAYVHAPVSTGFGIDLGATNTFQDVDRTLESEAKERLSGISRELGQRFPTLTLRTLVEIGHPAEHLVEMAHRESVDQIVLGSHGRRGLQRFFLGSVAERVLRLADRPVLVVKAPHPAPAS